MEEGAKLDWPIGYVKQAIRADSYYFLYPLLL
jgi:hypothetical protein